MPEKPLEVAEDVSNEQVAARVRDSANRIWLAGLGAFGKAQKEGTKVFDALVEEGEAVQKQAKESAAGKFRDVEAKVSESWDQLSWAQLQQVFEDGVGRALHALNVPSKKDLDALSHHVDELTKVTKRLSEKTEDSGRHPHA